MAAAHGTVFTHFDGIRESSKNLAKSNVLDRAAKVPVVSLPPPQFGARLEEDLTHQKGGEDSENR